MKIEILTPALVEAYDRFVLAHPGGLFYHSTKYKEFLKDLLGCEEEYVLVMDGSGLHGVLPLMYLQVGGDRLYNSLPYYGSHGGILADNREAYRKLTRVYNAIACRPTTIASTLIGNPFLEQGESGIVHCYADSRIGQWTLLSAGDADPERLLARIDPSGRRNVRKAQAEGIYVEIDCEQMDHLRRMHQDNMRAIGGLPKEDSFFTGVASHFQRGRDYEIYVAKRDGQIIAGLLVFYFNRTVEYFVPAVDQAYRSLQPSSLILITAMAEAARRGFKRWNWGGTWETQIGLHRFKRKWAALEKKYFYYTQLNDDSILSWSRPRILKTFPGFFVLPFFALRMEGTNDG